MNPLTLPLPLTYSSKSKSHKKITSLHITTKRVNTRNKQNTKGKVTVRFQVIMDPHI